MARGLILLGMKIFLTALMILALPSAVFAQAVPLDESLPAPEPLQVPVPKSAPDAGQDVDSDANMSPGVLSEIEGEGIVPEDLAPDYSKLSPQAERAARLDELFIKLAENENQESADLVAEEIVAIWSESGSASVNLLARRGTEAAAKGDVKTARVMYNHAVDLAPNYVEVWARSARLALTQKDFNRALNECHKTLSIEPRHFYTLWTLGNVLEALNRKEDALEAYREANRLYPELKAVKNRLAELETEVEGTVL